MVLRSLGTAWQVNPIHAHVIMSSSSRTAATSTVNTFDNLSLFQLALWNSAHTVGAEVGVAGLNAAKAAQVLIALFAPLGNQVLVRNLLLEAVIIQFSADSFPSVEKVVNIPRSLMVNAEDGPEGLDLPLALMRLRFSFSHLLIQFLQSRLN